VTWATAFRVRQYLSGSIWVVPLLGAIIGLVAAFVIAHIDRSAHLPAQWQYSASTATTLLSAIVGAMAALTGFVVTVTVLVVQMVIGSFSARYMRLCYRDAWLKGTLAFAFALLRRIENNFVPNIGVSVAGVLVIAGLVSFLYFFDRFLHRLRPVAVTEIAARALRRDFGADVAQLRAEDDMFSGPLHPAGEEPTLVVRSHHTGAIQAMNVQAMVAWARGNDCLLVLPHYVGDFVGRGDALFELYGGPGGDSSLERKLLGWVALGAERTIDQDPAFAMRIMVDVAGKALSAAINDPTTASQVLDYLTECLRLIGTTDLSGQEWRPDLGRRGVVIRVRRFEDFLALATTEIREYGATSIQVPRRMRAMLESLAEEVLPMYRTAVGDELARLDATVAQSYSGSADRDRAGTADLQGMGGPTPSETTKSPVEDGALLEAQTGSL
jgi:uncharacterized membrane protein